MNKKSTIFFKVRCVFRLFDELISQKIPVCLKLSSEKRLTYKCEIACSQKKEVSCRTL